MKKEYKKLVCIFSIIILLVGHAEISATENNSNFANLNTLKEGLLLSKNLKEVNDGFVYDINNNGRTDVFDFCRLKRNILYTEPPVTEPIVTEPPVTEPVWRHPDDYRLEEIVYDINAFNIIANRLNRDLLNGNGIEMEYGCTFGRVEAQYILALLNPNMINDDVLRTNLGVYQTDYIKDSTKFVYMISWLQEACGTDLDFGKYTLDPSIGQFLNSIDDAYRNGTINDVLNDIFVNGNIPEEYMHSPSILPILSSYDRNSTYVNSSFVDETCMNSFNESLCNIVFGYSYTK